MSGEAMRRSGTLHPGWKQAWRWAYGQRQKPGMAKRATRVRLGLARPDRAERVLRPRQPHRRARLLARRRRAAAFASPGPAAAAPGPARRRRSRRLVRQSRLCRQRRDPGRRRHQSRRAFLRLPRRHPARSAALARLPRPGDLLRGALGKRGRPARRRPGRAQPGPPPGLAEQRLRRRLSGADARRRRLPVHLHLRRLARLSARRHRLGAGAGARRRGARRPHSMPASACRPITIPAPSSRPGRRAWSRPR